MYFVTINGLPYGRPTLCIEEAQTHAMELESHYPDAAVIVDYADVLEV